MLGRGALSLLSQRGSGAVNPSAAYLAYAAASPLWYDVADQTKTFQDTAGTTPAVANADPVGRINNKGTAGVNYTQAVAGSRPTLSLSGSKFLASHNGTTSALSTGAYVFPAGSYSLFIVVEPGAAETKWLIGDSTNGAKLWAIPESGNTGGGGAAAGVGTDGSGPFPSFFIDGKRVANSLGTGASRDDLSVPLPPTERHILEIRGMDLSTSTGLRFGDYSGWEFFGKWGEVIVGLDPSHEQRESILYALSTKWSTTLQNSLAAIDWDDSIEREFGRFDAASTSARITFTTTATSLSFVGGINGGDGAASQNLGVYVNGVEQEINFPLITAAPQTVTITPSAGAKTITLVNGYRTKDTSGIGQGTFLHRVDANAPMTRSSISSASIKLVVGDSIACGAKASPLNTNGAWQKLRAVAPVPIGIEGLSQGSLFDIAGDSTKRAAWVARVQVLNPATMYIEHGTNDYGQSAWTAAAYGTAYAALLDALHTAMPSLTIECQSPFLAATETANGAGSTLGNYRTQVSSACSGRGWTTFIDGTTILALGDLTDGLHPSTAGHAIWYNFLKTRYGY